MPRLRPNAPRAAWGRTVDIPVSFKEITEAHTRRGFKVLVVGMAWKSVQALTKAMGIPASKDQAMMVSSLARQIYEAGKKGVDLFAHLSV